MTKAFEERIARRARARAILLAQALREAAAAELPADLTVAETDRGIAIAGRGLARRLAFDAALRGFARLLRGIAGRAK